MVSLSASVAYHAKVAPQRDALLYDGQRIGYEQLLGRVEAVAGMLRARGIRQDRWSRFS